MLNFRRLNGCELLCDILEQWINHNLIKVAAEFNREWSVNGIGLCLFGWLAPTTVTLSFGSKVGFQMSLSWCQGCWRYFWSNLIKFQVEQDWTKNNFQSHLFQVRTCLGMSRLGCIVSELKRLQSWDTFQINTLYLPPSIDIIPNLVKDGFDFPLNSEVFVRNLDANYKLLIN